ncbi:hypothetical protein ACTHGU_20275 [Chitinophagaceae bacterium MMS25-I14]
MKKLSRIEMKNVMGGILPNQLFVMCNCGGAIVRRIAVCIDGVAGCPDNCDIVDPAPPVGCTNG